MDRFELESERIVPLIIIHRQQITRCSSIILVCDLSAELSQDRSFFEYEMHATEEGDYIRFLHATRVVEKLHKA